jgi:putative Mg2+ transporter-C (MgtC) family protein
MLEWSEIALRLGVATLAGSAVGLNRDLHGKPIGLRTLSLVALATSMVVALTDPGGEVPHFSDASSRVVQGVLTWLTACIGIMCGAGQWRIVAVAVAITFVILMIGGGVEKRLHRALGGRDFAHDGDKSQPSDAGPHQPGK